MTLYYVATTGNDGAAGGLGSPFATVAKAVSVANPGDTINIRTGTYSERISLQNRSGGVGNLITIQNYGYSGAGTGEVVTFDYAAHGNYTDGVPYIFFNNASYWTINGITFQNFNTLETNFVLSKGISWEGSSTYDTLQDCKFLHIHENGAWDGNHALANCSTWGTGVHDITILRCEFGDIISVYGETLTARTGSYNILVQDCWFHDIDGIAANSWNGAHHTTYRHNLFEFVGKKRDGSTWYGNPANCMYVDGGNFCTYERNLIRNCNYGMAALAENGMPTAHDIVFRNNVIYDCDQAGIEVGTWYANAGPYNIKILNNTIYNCANGFRLRPYDAASTIFDGNLVSNCSNTIYGDGGFSYGTWNYNHYYSNGGGLTYGSNVLTSNPLFVNAGASPRDLSIQAGSPCVNSGDPSAQTGDYGTQDYLGNNRLNGVIDRGAYEYGATGGGGGGGVPPPPNNTYDPNSIGSFTTGAWYAIIAAEILPGPAQLPIIDSVKFNLSRIGYAPTITSYVPRWVFINGATYMGGVTIYGSDYAPGASLSMTYGANQANNVVVDSNTGSVLTSLNVPYLQLGLAPNAKPTLTTITNPDGSSVSITASGTVTSLPTAKNYVTSAVVTGSNYATGALASAAAPGAPAMLLPVAISINTGTSITIPSIPYDLLALAPGQNPIIRITNPDGSWADTSGATSTQTPPPPPGGGGGTPPPSVTPVLVSSAPATPPRLYQAKPASKIQHPSDPVVNRVQDQWTRVFGNVSGALAQMPQAAKGIFDHEKWATATLLNGWAPLTTSLPGFLKTAAGDVHLRGYVQADISVATLPILVLPVGYRPVEDAFAAVYVAGGTSIGMLQAAVDGTVRMLHSGGSTASPVVISLGGITFPASED